MTIRLFGVPGSPFVSKVMRALRLKGLDFELVQPAGMGDFKKWNPQTRKMPVIEIDGERVHDSTAILDRLDALQPEPALESSDPAVAARQRVLEDWSDESLYWHIMALRWCPEHFDDSTRQLAGALPGAVRPLAKMLVAKPLRKATQAQGFGRLSQEALERQANERCDDLMAMLGDSPFFFADRVSRADLAVRGQFQLGMSGPTPEIRAAVEARPELRAYLDRVDDAIAG
jgi:glutathione S-transferase